MLPDKIEHCIVFMNYWDVWVVSGVFWSFSKCNIKIPHLPADPSISVTLLYRCHLSIALIVQTERSMTAIVLCVKMQEDHDQSCIIKQENDEYIVFVSLRWFTFTMASSFDSCTMDHG